MNSINGRTTEGHWDDVWSGDIRMGLPSRFNICTENTKRLIKGKVKSGMRVLEIGCAPGKILAWLAKIMNASVAGLDYSERGISLAKKLFEALEIEGDLRCEDVFSNTFLRGSFDFVYSVGVVEHFDDAAPIVRQHMNLLRPGGMALVVIPNYGGVYGLVQRRLDNKNLLIHNLNIMNCQAMVQLVPKYLTSDIRAYTAGRISPWILSYDKKWPGLSRVIFYLINVIGLLQPFDIKPLCPMLVLEITRKNDVV
jgi:2-polyprenyl-3-methyl-5-hydroxy-6-metoxy-1,4-benzoquinol methylase